VTLPDPDQHSGRAGDVVIWDGQCNFCRQQVMRLRSLDWSGRLSFLSLHDARVAERYPQLTYEQLMAEMWVVTPDGQKFGGADALRVLSRHLPTLWPLAPLLHLPLAMPLWRSVYGWIARRRYRLAGKNCDSGSCDLHARR
jgi:predicted DCC family thiol-disulfide oxidoreductase YuxK